VVRFDHSVGSLLKVGWYQSFDLLAPLSLLIVRFSFICNILITILQLWKRTWLVYQVLEEELFTTLFAHFFYHALMDVQREIFVAILPYLIIEQVPFRRRLDYPLPFFLLYLLSKV